MSRIEDEVCKKIQGRAEVGKSKYGVTMETAPLSRLEWLVHAQEEAMDLAVYLQKLIEMEGGRSPSFLEQIDDARARAFSGPNGTYDPDWQEKKFMRDLVFPKSMFKQKEESE